MKLYDAGLSPNALRVRAVADELGLPLQLVEVNLGDPAARAAAIGGLNPNGKVPVLVDGDLVLWESRAIIAYLAAQNPEAGLYPDAPRARAVITDSAAPGRSDSASPPPTARATPRHTAATCAGEGLRG